MALFTRHRDKGELKAPPDEKVLKRIRMVETSDLTPWAEAALYEVGRSLSDYRKDGDESHLADAMQAAMLLPELVAEMITRQAVAVVVPHERLR